MAKTVQLSGDISGKDACSPERCHGRKIMGNAKQPFPDAVPLFPPALKTPPAELHFFSVC
jgi:hypothetical protein